MTLEEINQELARQLIRLHEKTEKQNAEFQEQKTEVASMVSRVFPPPPLAFYAAPYSLSLLNFPWVFLVAISSPPIFILHLHLLQIARLRDEAESKKPSIAGLIVDAARKISIEEIAKYHQGKDNRD